MKASVAIISEFVRHMGFKKTFTDSTGVLTSTGKFALLSSMGRTNEYNSPSELS